MFQFEIISILLGFLSGIWLGSRLFMKTNVGSAKLINRKYLEIAFNDGNLTYDFFLPYSKVKSLSSILVSGKTTKRIYRINGALIPSLSAKVLGEEALIYDKNGESVEVDSFNEITF